MLKAICEICFCEIAIGEPYAFVQILGPENFSLYVQYVH